MSEPSKQEFIAKRIKEALQDLNDHIATAATLGVEVEFNIIESATMGTPTTLRKVTAKIYKPL